MKILIDFLPGIFFLVALFAFDIYIATKVIMIAMTLQIVLLKIFKYPVNAMQWIAFIVIIGFGSATLIFHNADFIKLKPTIINWVFALALVLGPLFFNKNFIQALMSEQFELPTEIWKKLNYAWSLFFLILGFLNIWVAYNFPEKTWAIFKVFGIFALMLVFVVAQALYLSRFIKPDEAAPEETP